MQNPYGAVPESLKDMSNTILAISKLNLEGAKQDQELALAKAKTETERTLIEAGLEKDRLTNLKDVAQLEEMRRAHQASEQHASAALDIQSKAEDFRQGPQFDLQKKNVESEIRTRGAHAALAGMQGKALARELEEKPLGNWLAQTNIDPRIITTMGFNPNMVMTRGEAKALQTQYGGYIAHMGIALADKDRKDIESKLPTARPEDIPLLEKQYNDVMGKAQMYGIQLKAAEKWTSHDDANFLNRAITNGQTAEEAAQNLQSIKSTMQNTKLAGEHLNSSPVAFDTLKKKITVNPFFDQRAEEASKIIQKFAPEDLQKGISVGYINRLKEGDYKGAYDYITGHANQLQTQAKNGQRGATFTERMNEGMPVF